MRIRKSLWTIRTVVIAAAVAAASPALAMDPAFTYQGQLKLNEVPITGSADLEFRLWDEAGSGEPPTGGSQVGPTLTFDGLGGNPAPIAVANGLFTVQLDFGSDAFTGNARWLGIVVTYPSGSGVPIILSPRQPITPAPYALALPGLWAQQNATSPNLIGGYDGNTVTANVAGATIGGGGQSGLTNRVTDEWGTIGGGRDNQAGDNAGTTLDALDATVAGGSENIASGLESTVGGGNTNTASGRSSTVAGGYLNNASNGSSVVSGGSKNSASGAVAAVAGGYKNAASGEASAIGGGEQNSVKGSHATVPGGSYNQAWGSYAFAAGQRAQANHGGSFVWSDSSTQSPDFFASTNKNQFLIRALGGVGINTNAPGAALHIGGTAGTDGLMFPDGTLQMTAAVGGSGDSLWSDFGSDIFYTAGKVGVGTSSPGYRLHVVDSLSTAIRGEAGSSGGYAGHFVHTGAAGTALYAESNGLGRDYATLQAHNTRVSSGMAAYMTSVGSWATMHVENDGTGEVLWLARDNSDSEFIVANNELTGGRVFSVDHDGSTTATSLEITGAVGVDGLTFADGTVQTTAASGGGDSVWSGSGGDIFYTAGNVGIGTSNPTEELHLAGNALVDGSVGIGTAPVHSVKLGINSDSLWGLKVENTTVGGQAIWAEATAASGGTSGVYGKASAPGGVGVWGEHSATSGDAPAVYGRTSSTANLAPGVKGEALSAASGAFTVGVMGLSHAGLSVGVYGKADYTDPAIPTKGGYFESTSSNGIGVHGLASGAGAFAGYFSGRGYFSGDVGIGTSSPDAKLDVEGTARVNVLQIDGGADLSENFAIGGSAEPGMVVVIDSDRPGALRTSTNAYDRRVAGIISGAGGVQTGMLMSQEGSVADGEHPVALTGRVYCWCDASGGAIEPGDMLTTSHTPGHAMKVTDFARAQGAIIGKAMTSLEADSGLVLVLVNLQ